MPVEDLEGKRFTCHICSKECTYAPLYTNVYVTGILWFVEMSFEELADSVVITAYKDCV